MNQIKFNVPTLIGKEEAAVKTAILNRKLSGDGSFNKSCAQILREKVKSPFVYLTPSCTAALEMAYMLLDLKKGDEVIMPSFTFTSTATSVVVFGGTPVFVDIDETCNVDVDKILAAVTEKTKAICVVHYAGYSCDLDKLSEGIKKFNRKIFIVEDAAQALGSTYKGRPLGGIGDISAFSFHETKNIVCGEGGAICVNNPDLLSRAEIIRDKGTNRQRFLRGEVDKYTWQDVGSSYLLGELPAAYLYEQLKAEEMINNRRRAIWNDFYRALEPLQSAGKLKLPVVPEFAKHNGHIFYIIANTIDESEALIKFCLERGIQPVRHYVPLHSAPAGKKFGITCGSIENTHFYADKLVRLPIYYNLDDSQKEQIINAVLDFYGKY